MVHGAVFLEQFGGAVTDAVWMGEAKVDEEGVRVLLLFPSVEVSPGRRATRYRLPGFARLVVSPWTVVQSWLHCSCFLLQVRMVS